MAQNSYKNCIKPALIFLAPFFVVIVFYLTKFFNIESLCLWKFIFHKACIGCGMGHAIISLLKLDFNAAFSYNPLVVIVFPLLVYIWIKTFIRSLNNFNL